MITQVLDSGGGQQQKRCSYSTLPERDRLDTIDTVVVDTAKIAIVP